MSVDCRPYGVASLLAVHDKDAGAQLYLVEPSGDFGGKVAKEVLRDACFA